MRKVVLLLALILPVSLQANMVKTIQEINKKLPIESAVLYAARIRQYSISLGLDPNLVAAVIATESGFNPHSKGSKGEIGLMQLRPEYHGGTAELWHPETNIYVGILFLSSLRSIFEYQYPNYRWLELYNRGPNAKPKRFPYTAKVLKYYRMFEGTVGGSKAIAEN